MEIVQKLMFCTSTQGNLLPLIKGHFDYRHGSKLVPATYTKIAKLINVKAKKILFITDVLQEGLAASKAKYKVAIIQRATTLTTSSSKSPTNEKNTSKKSPKNNTSKNTPNYIKKINFISSLQEVFFVC